MNKVHFTTLTLGSLTTRNLVSYPLFAYTTSCNQKGVS